jgi:hypothetical protein
MSNLADTLASSLRSGLVGLSPDEFKKRLEGWLVDAAKEASNIQDAAKKAKATKLYAEYLYWQDAVNHHLDSAERVEVDREGSVDMGDWSARLKGLKAERDGALLEFQNLLVEPDKASPTDTKHSFFMPNEYVW